MRYSSIRMKIGIGITTYNRPEYFKECLTAVIKHTKDLNVRIYAYNDGSKVAYPVWKSNKYLWYNSSKNQGVAHAKNFLLEQMLAEGMEHLFLIEDDIIIKDSKAFTEYIRISEKTGFEHLMFAHHGDANKDGTIYKDEDIDYYPQCIGAFAYYTRNAIETLIIDEKRRGRVYPGFFDENYHNAWEHVEHTMRLSLIGLTAPFGMFVDIPHSRDYIAEIPGSIANSSIRPHKDWMKQRLDGLAYWEKKFGNKAPIQLGVEKVQL